MPHAPLAVVKQRFGSKEALVEAVQKLVSDELWLDRVDADKGLDSVSNRKLLHLHDTLTRVKKDFGTRAKLVAAIAKDRGKDKDKDWAARLERFPTPRLFALWSAGHLKQPKESAGSEAAKPAAAKPTPKADSAAKTKKPKSA